MVLDSERIEDKIDRIFEELKEHGKIVAVQEQKLREINHRMGDGQQRNIFSHELLKNEMTKRLDMLDKAIESKVELQDYKEALTELKDTFSKYTKIIVIMSILLLTGSGFIANADLMKKLLTAIIGLH